ncbi:glycosyltransferase family 4 protein [Marinomonas flavescens]|uniref:glycosyltransferase family 4 protein n=1 Tax=Marinomonas flavescens TaxID=2529379 RepID=UPI0010566624|nr:glycosyltransferase family 4 protein [Marinomonas flavescens]
MKVLIVNTSDILGGAARAAYRLHQSLLAEGVDSQMLVQSKSSDDFTVHGPVTKIRKGLAKLRPLLDSLPVRFYKNRTQTLFSPSWLPFSDIVSRINQINPDVVHLHWIAGGMMRIEDIAKIKAPIVWSLHDMWPFTDGYHYDAKFDIENNVLPEIAKSALQSNNLKRKRKAYRKVENMTIVGLSEWLANCSKKSDVLGDKNHIRLPNPINTSAYSPFSKIKARELLNLPLDKNLILFGAMGATSDPRKGYKQLSDALKAVDSKNTELIVFGSSAPNNGNVFSQKTHYLGTLHDDVTLRVLYSAADVIVVPSLQENLSNAIMESLACGTPVVGFDIGGNSDLIDHKSNGYLAKPYNTVDLAEGISWVLNHPMPSELSTNAREKVLANFDSKLVATQYIDLYKGILKK